MTDDRLGPPPVENLSDVTWARVERGLWARMDGSVTTATPVPARRWWIAGSIAAIAAVATIVLVERRGDTPVDREVAGPIGSDASDVRVVAPATASTTATFNDAHIEVAPASVVVMRHDRPTTMLERGSAWFAVAPRVDRAPFVVIAGDATVRVLGTRFRVARSEDRVVVEVDHGAVEVRFRGRLESLRDRQSWSSDRPDQIVSLAATASADDEIEFAPTQVVRRPKQKPAAAPVVRVEPTERPFEPPRSGSDPDHAKFERLGVLEKTSPQAAIAGYLALSQKDGRWAANALYAAGRLAADRRDPRAQTLLQVYLRRFPSGANVEDARALLARLPAPRE